MPKNPSRKAQGGDVEGEVKTYEQSAHPGIMVAEASFDPGYDMSNSTKLLGKKLKADLLRGYCDYGRAVGDDPFEHWDKV